MINIREDGELLKQGFNFYPLRSKGSIGFVLKLGKATFTARYSKKLKKLLIRNEIG